jgi:hypothetical protein
MTMKILKIGLVGTVALTLAACPDRGPDPTVDPLTDPTVTAVDTPTMMPADPAAPPVGAQTATLQPVGAATTTGEVHAVPQQNSTEVWVTVRNGTPNASMGVRVHSGTCDSPGPELARVDAIGTDGLGNGQSRTNVGHAPNLIMDGNHIVAVYAPGTEPTRDPPVACSTLPQMGATAGM